MSSKRASLGAIFLTVFIDLVGFSIIFPLFPAMLQYYLPLETDGGLLTSFVSFLQSVAPDRPGAPAGIATHVFFGGVLGSLYSFLQFVASPIWGRLSDSLGRRKVLLLTISGTLISYLLWAVSGQFWILIAARLLGGIMAGNISVATAAVADVTSSENRSRGMAVIGIAFALGFIVGPAIGGFASLIDITAYAPELIVYGANPFTIPALVAAVLSAVNLFWVWKRLPETLVETNRLSSPIVQNPFARLKTNGGIEIRKVMLTYFFFLLAFSGMEFTLTFLALERLGYGPAQNAYLFVFVGFVLVFVQGMFVRRYANKVGEKKLALAGVISGSIGFAFLAMADSSALFYAGLFFKAVGVGLCSPTLTALVSLYSPAHVQGSALGAFRASGALARAIGPLLVAATYWGVGPAPTYLIGAVFLVLPLVIAATLPQPAHQGIAPARG